MNTEYYDILIKNRIAREEFGQINYYLVEMFREIDKVLVKDFDETQIKKLDTVIKIFSLILVSGIISFFAAPDYLPVLTLLAAGLIIYTIFKINKVIKVRHKIGESKNVRCAEFIRQKRIDYGLNKNVIK